MYNEENNNLNNTTPVNEQNNTVIQDFNQPEVQPQNSIPVNGTEDVVNAEDIFTNAEPAPVNNNVVNVDQPSTTISEPQVSTPNQVKKKSPLKLIIILITILLVLGAAGFFGFKTLTKANIDRTLMIYMVGADLESENGLATVDLSGLDYKKLNSNNTKVIVMAGGSKQWYNDYIDKTSTSIYELTDSGLKEVKKQTKKNMGQADTLASFLEYGYENYKSSEYDLMLWNHGGGILGGEYDELYGHDQLTGKEFENALYKSPFNKNNKLELVIFRTCLNGTLEIATTFKDYADYMVASEEITNGNPAVSLFTNVNEISSSKTAEKVGKDFIDGYMSYIKEINKVTNSPEESGYQTYSLLDLSKINELDKSVNDLFSSIDLSKDYNKVASVRSKLYQYGDDGLSSKYYDSVDLYNFVDQIKDLSPDKANKVLKNIDSIVLYNRATDTRSKGISIYFPYNGKKQEKSVIISDYYTFEDLSDYKTFITKFNTIQSGGKKTSFSANTVSLTPSTNSNYDFEYTLTSELLDNYAKAEYMVIRDNKDGTFKQVYNSSNVELDGNKIKASVKGKQLDVVSKETNESYIINVYEKNNTDDYIEYVTYPVLEYMPVEDINSLQNWKIQKAKMSLILDKKTNEITMGNVSVQPKNVKDGDNNTNSIQTETYNVVVDINEYDDVVFGSTSFNMFDENGNYTTDWDNNGVYNGFELKPENVSFKLDDFTSGEDYYAVFAIYDTYNNVYFSDKVKMN